MGDFLCHADIGKHIKYFYYDQNLVVMATARETFFPRRLKIGTNGFIYMDFQKKIMPPPLPRVTEQHPGPPLKCSNYQK